MSIARLCTLATGLLLATLHSDPASARLTLCAGTVSDLLSRVQSINAQPGQDFDLRLKSGYYTLGTTPSGEAALRINRGFVASAGELRSHRISGRWNDDCSAQVPSGTAGAATVIDGAHLTRILDVGAVGSNQSDEIHNLQIDNLTFFRGSEVSDYAVSSSLGLSVSNQNAVRLVVMVDRVRIQDSAGSLAASFDGMNQLTIRNSLFLHNECQPIPGQCGDSVDFGYLLRISTRAQGRTFLQNNTFRLNFQDYPRQTHDLLSIRESNSVSNSSAALFNNIFADMQGPGSIEVVVRGSITSRSNVFRPEATPSLSGGTLVVSGNTTVDPGFANATSLLLGSGSALRDFGTSVVPGSSIGTSDHAGNARVQGSAIEPGAYELEDPKVFGNGFE